MTRTIQIHSQFGNALLFKELQGTEQMSGLYAYHLLLSSQNANLGIDAMVGSQLSVQIEGGRGIRYLQGVVTDFGYEAQDEDEQGYHIYSCTIRPNFWYLTQTQNSRVFVDKDVLQITQTILSELGIEFENKCQNQYRTYGQSTQYCESDFNYLNRLFEQEGIYYYFIHGKDKNTLVLSDQNSQQEPIIGNDKIFYHANVFAGAPHESYLDAWQHKQHLNTSKVSLGDYNYQKTKAHLITDTKTHNLSGQPTERFEPYTHFKTLDEATHYKQIHKEHYQALTHEIIASGNVLNLCAGFRFTLQRHPHNKANGEYLITEVSFYLKEAGYTTGDELTKFRTTLKAIPFDVQYRPVKHTPKPQVVGTQAAIITGPAGEEVYTNEYGDIKLQFHWDRYGPMNEKSSAWIRVIQASAGVNFGSVNIPRIGEEVLVDFINGDIDRPVVSGRLYNVANQPPWGYPASAKKSGIKSKSFNSPIENFNEFMFDDTAGAELVNFQAQKDLTSLIKNDETRHIKNNRTTTVDVDETITVHGKRTETVDKDETITIHQNRTETVDKDETITIHQNRKERVDKDETISIGGNRTETVEGDEKILIQGNRDKTVDKNDTLTIKQNQKHTIQKNKSLTVNKNSNEMVKVAKSVTVGTVYATQVGTVMNTAVGMMQAEEVGIKKTTMVGKSYNITAGDAFTLTVGSSSLTLNQDGTIILQGIDIQIIGSTKVDIIGKDVNINPEGMSEPTDEELEAWANQAIDESELLAGPGGGGLHHIRNTFHSQPAGTDTLDGFAKWASTADPNSYKVMSASESQYHNIGYQNRGINLKVVFFENQKSLNSSSEVIYSTKTGKMVNDALNGGTFNYYDNSKSTTGHILTDVIPYWVSGNNSNDPNSLSTRVFGMYSPMSAEYSGEATNPLIEFGGFINDIKTGYSKVDEYRRLYDIEHKKLLDKIDFYKRK